LSVAEVFCIVAQIFLPVSAKVTSAAGNKGINADTLVEQMSIGFVEDLVDNTCKLMAEDDVWRIVDMAAESLLAPGVLAVEVTNVTAADTAFGDLD